MSRKTNQQVALEIIAGQWGNGIQRRQRLEAAGYSYAAIQSIVNAVMTGSKVPEEKPQQPERMLHVEFDAKTYDGMEVEITV